MRILSLIGSLTAGATIAVGLFQLPVVARVALLVAAIVVLYFVRKVRSRSGAPSSGVTFVVDNEFERYSGADVAEFFAALSKAKATTQAPFYPSPSNRRIR